MQIYLHISKKSSNFVAVFANMWIVGTFISMLCLGFYEIKTSSDFQNRTHFAFFLKNICICHFFVVPLQAQRF